MKLFFVVRKERDGSGFIVWFEMFAYSPHSSIKKGESFMHRRIYTGNQRDDLHPRYVMVLMLIFV